MRAPWIVLPLVGLAACGSKSASTADAPLTDHDGTLALDAPPPPIDAPVATPCTGTPTECAAMWEQNAATRYDGLLTDPAGLVTFLTAVPKGGDLHNHLSGAVYAETYLGWAQADGDCINSSSYAAPTCRLPRTARPRSTTTTSTWPCSRT